MILTCDNCHYTFSTNKEEHTLPFPCPKCNKTTRDHFFANTAVKVYCLRRATAFEEEMYNLVEEREK